MTATMYVRKDCPHCKNAEALVQSLPSNLRSKIRVSEINFKNRPPNVTRVPTLITQQGKMLVGEQVFAYLKRWRHDADPPHTEAFQAIKRHKMKCLLLIVAFLLAAYWFWSRRTGGTGLSGLLGSIGLGGRRGGTELVPPALTVGAPQIEGQF